LFIVGSGKARESRKAVTDTG